MTPLDDNVFQRLGDAIAEETPAEIDLTKDFPEIAARLLREWNPGVAFTGENILDWVLRQKDLGRQDNFGSRFGDSALTLYSHERFYIELLWWYPGRTAIHEHGFAGAFRVLSGLSVQTEYLYKQTKLYAPGLMNGTLELQNIALLEPGATYPIIVGERFIHSVVHLGRPSLTLVVRTSSNVPSQLSYTPTGLAFDHWHLNRSLTSQANLFVTAYYADPQRTWPSLEVFAEQHNLLETHLFADKLFWRLPKSAQSSLFSWMEKHMGEVYEPSRAALDFGTRSRSLWQNIANVPEHHHCRMALIDLLGKNPNVEEVLAKFVQDPDLFLTKFSYSRYADSVQVAS